VLRELMARWWHGCTARWARGGAEGVVLRELAACRPVAVRRRPAVGARRSGPACPAACARAVLAVFGGGCRGRIRLRRALAGWRWKDGTAEDASWTDPCP
jgi:hypothetical protein